MSKGKTKISLFDLDQTLLATNSSYQFGAHLYKAKFFSLPSMLYYVGCYVLHKINVLDIGQIHQKIFNTLFFDKPADEFIKQANEFLDHNLNSMLYLPAMERLEQAKRENHHTVILSSSPEFLVEEIAKRWGVDEWKGTRFQLDKQRRFSAIADLMDGERKSSYLRTLSAQLSIPLSACIAYSDSILDLPLLKMAGKAVGVRPDSKLKSICKKHQWEII